MSSLFPPALHPSNLRSSRTILSPPSSSCPPLPLPANIHPTHSFIHSSTSVNLDLDRNRALLRLQHNQVVIVRDILNGSIDKTSPGNNLQSNQRSHNVDFAVRQARRKRKEKVSTQNPTKKRGKPPLTFPQHKTSHPCRKPTTSSATYNSASHPPTTTSPAKTHPGPGKTSHPSG
jgi:hypothetical protein